MAVTPELMSSLGEFGLGGEVEVGEEDQALAEAVVLGLDGFLDLHDHVGAGPDVVGVGDDLGAGDGVFLVGDARAQACAALHQDGVAVGAELVDAGGGDGDAEFVVLDLFGDTDDHLWAPSLAGLVGRNVRGSLCFQNKSGCEAADRTQPAGRRKFRVISGVFGFVGSTYVEP